MECFGKKGLSIIPITFFNLGFLILFWTWDLWTLLFVVLPLVITFLFRQKKCLLFKSTFKNDVELLSTTLNTMMLTRIFTFSKDFLQKQTRSSELKNPYDAMSFSKITSSRTFITLSEIMKVKKVCPWRKAYKYKRN